MISKDKKEKKKGEKIMNCFKNQLSQSKVRKVMNESELNEIIEKLLRGEII